MHRVLLVGGGTAGHVEPALAVAHWLLENSEDIACEFVGTSSGIEQDLVPSAGLKLHTILKAPLPRTLNISTILWPVRLTIAIAQALRILRSADLVIGFGGYVSAPCYLAARILGVKLLIHEANAIPGWANKLGSKFADENLVAFKSTINSTISKEVGNGATSRNFPRNPIMGERNCGNLRCVSWFMFCKPPNFTCGK